jgi:hypothetical protein
MQRAARFLASAASIASFLCVAASYDGTLRPIDGLYTLSPNSVDPAPGAPLDSHLYVRLEGDTARELYDAMKVEPKFDACTDSPMKKIGGMECTIDTRTQAHQCNFAINISTQKIEPPSC